MKLSILVPVYNEEQRAGKFLKQLIAYSQRNLTNYEILFINDGSTDNSLELLKKIKGKDQSIRIISYKNNKGKGYAVRTGIFEAKGENIIFIDADGSIQPDQIKLMMPLLNKSDIVIGYRYSKEANIKQPILRSTISFFFNSYVELLFDLRIKDTLCGFKGFKNKVAKNLFFNLKSPRWIFDVEILKRARRKNYRISKLPIKWVHVGDTKMSLIDPIKMGLRLFKLRLII